MFPPDFAIEFALLYYCQMYFTAPAVPRSYFAQVVTTTLRIHPISSSCLGIKRVAARIVGRLLTVQAFLRLVFDETITVANPLELYRVVMLPRLWLNIQL